MLLIYGPVMKRRRTRADGISLFRRGRVSYDTLARR